MGIAEPDRVRRDRCCLLATCLCPCVRKSAARKPTERHPPISSPTSAREHFYAPLLSWNAEIGRRLQGASVDRKWHALSGRRPSGPRDQSTRFDDLYEALRFSSGMSWRDW